MLYEEELLLLGHTHTCTHTCTHTPARIHTHILVLTILGMLLAGRHSQAWPWEQNWVRRDRHLNCWDTPRAMKTAHC